MAGESNQQQQPSSPSKAAENYRQRPYYQPPSGIPAPGPVPSAAPVLVLGRATLGQWTTGLCNCFDDVPNCCWTLWCPCVTFGRIAEIVDRGSISSGTATAIYLLVASITGCQFIYSFLYRTKLRAQHSLPEEPCHDCLVHFFCHGCALCQEYRELRNRGFDMLIGWHGNMDRMSAQGGGVNVPPPVQGGMTR